MLNCILTRIAERLGQLHRQQRRDGSVNRKHVAHESGPRLHGHAEQQSELATVEHQPAEPRRRVHGSVDAGRECEYDVNE